MDDKTKNLTRDDIESLTSMQTAKMRGVEFAGFLVREDDNAIYVADPQGTWRFLGKAVRALALGRAARPFQKTCARRENQ